MPIGSPGAQSFERAIVKCKNQHIAAGLAPLMVFRQELISNDELKDRGGMDKVTQAHFLAHLVKCDRIRRQVTYNPDDVDLKSIVAKGIDPTQTIEKTEASTQKPTGGDEVQGQSGREFALPWAFDGSDANFPSLAQVQLVSPTGLLLLNAIDVAIVQWTRLESRHRTRFITPMDSLRVYGNYQQIYEFLQQFGGDENRVDVANPLPSEEPLGPQSSANRVGEPTANAPPAK